MAFKIYILWSTIVGCYICIIKAQKCPTLPANNDETLDAIRKVTGTTPKDSEYPAAAAKRLVRSRKYRDSVIDAEKTLKYCLPRDNQTLIPPFKSPFSAYPVCPTVERYFVIPTRLNMNDKGCWVLRQWAEEKCHYVRCTKNSCGVQQEGPTSVITRFVCRPTNARYLKIYGICPKRPRGWELRWIQIPLTQCCSCVRVMLTGIAANVKCNL